MRERRNVGFIFWLAFFTCYCHISSNGDEDGKSRQTYVIRYKDGEQTIPVTVVLDYKKQTEYVINMNPRTPAKSVTLYDFKQRTIAYKDLTNRECFLGRLTHETLSEESSALQDVKNPVEVRPKVRSLDPRMPALTPTEIRNLAGQKTAVFCRKMNTWLLMPERSHSVSKREATEDEFEERTLQYHGHRSSQYSHYERETRRRFRNRNHPNHKRRSRTKESAARNENGGFEFLERSTLPPSFNSQSSNRVLVHPDHIDSIADADKQNPSYNYEVTESPFSQKYVEDGKENINKNGATYENSAPFNGSITNQVHFRHPESEKDYSVDSVVYPRPHYINSDETTERSSNKEIISETARRSSQRFEESAPLPKAKSEDNSYEKVNAKTIPTENSSVSFEEDRNVHPNVHSSLLHLLPLYKPLGQEFDFSEKTGTEDEQISTNRVTNIESEGHPLPKPFKETGSKLHFSDVEDTSTDPDVSVNVLEIPKITKKFENVQNNISNSSSTQPHSHPLYHSSFIDNPLLENTSKNPPYHHYGNSHGGFNTRTGHLKSPTDRNINNAEENLNRNRINLPHLGVPVTTEPPALTTREYKTPDRGTDSAYVPAVHTAFKNLDDFNSFQIFSNYVEEDIISSPTETNSSVPSFHANRDGITNASAHDVPQHLILTTAYPLEVRKHAIDSNHRSDIPSESETDSSRSFNQDRQKNYYPSNINNRTRDNFSSHKIRYQTALRDFKPDEIIIDIESIPTHTTPPVTASFHQRILTTIQPTVRSLSSEGVRSEINRRREQISRTAQDNLAPVTRFPRRRLNDKSRRPVHQSGSFIPTHRASSYQQHLRPPPQRQINQLFGVNQYDYAQHSNRRQFHYPSQPIPRSHLLTDMNQLHHMHSLNNLPPGVSVHPRHPQAPFADMVHSNRPPTIPLLSDHQAYLIPHHRQRHHRKKERHQNSCCRFRGKPGAFQSCCRNGGACCTGSHKRMQPAGASCCSSPKVNGHIFHANQIQPPVKTVDKILPPVRTEETHRNELDNRDRCQKEKMCRTLYESTQQIMVCRNAHIDGC